MKKPSEANPDNTTDCGTRSNTSVATSAKMPGMKSATRRNTHITTVAVKMPR